MQAIWLENQQLRLRTDIPIPEPAEKEVLVRVRLAGICATDLELVRGYYPYTGILGHEFVGEIVQPTERAGQSVVGEINIACGRCTDCQQGRVMHCAQRQVLGIRDRAGAFAEYLCLPLANLWPIPPSIPDEVAVFTEPLAAALAIQTQVDISPTQRVLIIGGGRLGQLIAQTLTLTGCDLQVVARHPKQQALLTARHIAWITEQALPTRAIDIVIEATGTPDGLALAQQAVRPRGIIVLKSTYHGTTQFNFSTLVVNENQLIGSRCGRFAPALQLLASKQIDPTGLIEGCLPLAKGLHALAWASQAGVLKVLLQCPSH